MNSFPFRRALLLCTLLVVTISLHAQNNFRGLIEGSKGLSNSFTTLQASQRVPFEPSGLKALLGLDQQSDLVLMNAESDQIGYVHYRYYETYNGVPVENTMYIVHVKNGMITGMSGSIILDFDEAMPQRNMISVSSDAAVKSATNVVAAKSYMWQSAEMEQRLKDATGDVNATYKPKGELVWYAAGDEIAPRDLRLAYKIDVYALEPVSRAFYYVDAQTGRVLGKNDVLEYSDATGTATTAYSGTQTIHSDLNAGSYRLRDYTKGNGIITLKATSGHPDYSSSSANWSFTNNDKYALDAHWGVSQTYAFYLANFNRNSINNAGYALTSYVNETSTVDNAYWDGNIMHFGVRSGSSAGVTAIDVAGHELTHGVTQYTSNLTYSNQSGAMNESMSDIMGKSVQFWSKPTDVNWLLSNDMNWLIRNFQNPNQYGQPDTYLGTHWYSGSSDNGGVHTNSGVGNFMFYLLVAGGSGTNDIGNAYSVSSIGLSEADQIIYRTETVYLTPSSNYSAWRTACINAATDLYGASSNEVTQVMNAWYAVGIGTAGGGGGTCGTPTGLASSSVTSGSATVSWSAASGATSYNLQYKLSTSSTWTTVTTSGTSYNLSGLTSSSTYNFQVQTVCASGSSAYSTAASFTTLSSTGVTYCTSAGSSTAYEYINRVAIGSINNTSGNNNGYANFTGLSTNLTGGSSVTITLVPGFTGSSYTEDWNVYIDWNQNGTFSSAEKVTTASSTGTNNKTFTVPTTALNGATRMRVQMRYNSYPSGPCSTFNYGEVEDYTVSVSGNLLNGTNRLSDAAANGALPFAALYPNPASEFLTVHFNVVSDVQTKIEVVSLTGQILKSDIEATGAQDVQLNVADLPKGIYFVRLTSDGAISTTKFAKE